MESVKTNSLTKKSLKVAVNKPAILTVTEPVIRTTI